MESQDLNCNICFRLARDALECSYPQCRKLFCVSCYNSIKDQFLKQEVPAKCPFCRVQKFQVCQSPLRPKINNRPIKCKHCQKPFKFQIVDKHQSECEQRKVNCRICSKLYCRKQLVTHTKTAHKQMVDTILLLHHTHLHPIIEPQTVIQKEASKLKYEDKPHIGTTGKFYCSGALEGPKCKCCNGKCGPTNGQNCVKCMQLDLVRRGVGKGYLVHAGGGVCWIDRNQHFACGTMFSYERKTCGKEGYCKWCHNIQITIQRYKTLL